MVVSLMRFLGLLFPRLFRCVPRIRGTCASVDDRLLVPHINTEFGMRCNDACYLLAICLFGRYGLW